MSANVDIRLTGPLQKIAQLAISHAEACQDRDLDLFDLRGVIRNSKDAIVAYLRSEVEARTNGRQTVREISHTLVRTMGLVRCVVCPIGTPEGVVTRRLDGAHAFAVSGSATGYIPLAYK